SYAGEPLAAISRDSAAAAQAFDCTRPVLLHRSRTGLVSWFDAFSSEPASTSPENALTLDRSRLRRRRRCGEIGAAAARQKLAGLVIDMRLGAGELPADADDLALGSEITRHRRGMIVDAQVDGRNAAPGLLHHRPVGGEIDQRRQDAAVGVAAIRV